METQSTQAGQAQGAEIDFKEFLGEQVTAPETPQEEVVEVEGQQIPVTEVDNPKSYKFFQSKFTKEQEERLKIEKEKIRIEAELNALKQYGQPQTRQEQAPPQRPKPVLPMPQGFSMIDATTDPNSESARWYSMKLNSDVEWQNYNDYFISQQEQERHATLEERRLAQQKALAISKFQEAGTTPEEAVKINDWFTGVLTRDDFGEIVNAYRLTHSQPNSQVQERINQMQKLNGQQGTIPLPPSAIPAQTVPREEDFGDFLLNTTKKFRI